MLVGLAPMAAYRTLNLPAVENLAALARGPRNGPIFAGLFRGAVQAAGIGVRVFDPIETRREHLMIGAAPKGECIDDPELAAWLFGRSWLAEQGPWAHRFTIWRAGGRPARAWLLPFDGLDDPGVLDDW